MPPCYTWILGDQWMPSLEEKVPDKSKAFPQVKHCPNPLCCGGFDNVWHALEPRVHVTIFSTYLGSSLELLLLQT
ncbi:hypothetical protein LINGRAHAP2_LOCUS30180 [Linum grandiflorum]